MPGLPVLPPTASNHAVELNWLFAGLLGTTGAVLLLVFWLMLLFCVRYRRGSAAVRPSPSQKSWHWEVTWTAATFVAFLALYFWGADFFLRLRRAPAGATEIFVVGKQWMWKAEHPGGQREIDTLHLPVNRPVRLVMTSQDVIHDFFVPAFRVKQDVLPGRYEDLWFTPTEVGTFPLFCAEFCGTEHAHMGGEVIIMEPAAFSDWLEAERPSGSLAEQGAALFRQYGCSGCHGPNSTVHAPPLEGLYGRPVPLQSGAVVMADEAYLRDSILQPQAQIAAGYPAVMPSFAGQIGEEDLMKLIAYIKSLAPRAAGRS
ncbi:MAG: cytochrome c oxidase subunit II [Alphaproteobacteria bacterium]|nr:cytochrome c oxidase subunit II [Alphaproteobacteria bacterium]